MLRKIYRTFLFLLLTFLIVNISSAKNDEKTKALDAINSNSFPINSADVNLFFEDWESGIGTWLTNDETSIDPQWHLTDWRAYGGSGLSWHMADTALGTNGGYNNSWYQVLDTDTFSITGTNPELTFYHRYSVEGPAGASAPYNGWDGMNVRISTDGGTTWEVLANPTPAYTATSLFSFGDEHGEGANIPGWAGDLTTWTLVTFDLSAYAGQTVMIRFAFASDPAFATGFDGGPDTLFAWQVDSIVVANSTETLFINEGEEAGFTPLNWAATGVDLWHVETGDAFSGTQYATCNDVDTTYAPNMTNSLTSDWFELDPLATDIYMDFYLRGTFDDNDAFPASEFFGVYVQVQGETGRRFVSNITQDPAGSNFVYSSAPATWSLFSLSYSIIIELTSLKGETIRIIFEFESDEDTPIGKGLEVDDVIVWTPEIVPVELTSFSATSNNNNVHLNWATATETNNRIFEVERKSERGQFLMIGFVDGKGTTVEEQHYSYVDSKVNSGNYVYRLKQIDFDGKFEYSNEIEVEVIAPLVFELGQNYPNPFNPSTKINFSIAEAGNIKLGIYNMLGEEIKLLINEFKEAGHYDVSFDASNLPSGIYLYKLETPQFTQMKKMLLTK